jgi:3-deoxy-D-manno-octulosonate 8-phosphate phosphatase (KDO 8-P phosphatase)
MIRCVVVDMSSLCDADHPLSLGSGVMEEGDFLYIPDKNVSQKTHALSFKTYDGFAIRNLFQNVLGTKILILSHDTLHEVIYHRRCDTMHVSDFFFPEPDKWTFLQHYAQEHGFALDRILLFDHSLSAKNPRDQQLASSVALFVGDHEFASDASISYVEVAAEPHGYVRAFAHAHLESMESIQAYYAKTREGKVLKSSATSADAKPIRALVLDIDGTCTNACRIFSADGREWKRFCKKDLQALRQWVDSGKILCFLTGECSPIVVRWAEICGVDPERHLIMEAAHLKVQHLHQIAGQFHLQLEEIAYMGDDINDLGILEHVAEQNGFAACPQNAVPQILKIPSVHLVPSYGGNGACADVVATLAERS